MTCRDCDVTLNTDETCPRCNRSPCPDCNRTMGYLGPCHGEDE